MPKRQFIWNCSYSDFSCAISGFTSNDRAPGGPVTFWWPMWGQRLPKLQNVPIWQNVPKLPKNVQSSKSPKITKNSTFRVKPGILKGVCDRVFCECQSVHPRPRQAQEPCSAFPSLLQLTSARSGPRSLAQLPKGPGRVPSVQGASQRSYKAQESFSVPRDEFRSSPGKTATPAIGTVPRTEKHMFSGLRKTLSWAFYFIYLTFEKLKSYFSYFIHMAYEVSRLPVSHVCLQIAFPVSHIGFTISYNFPISMLHWKRRLLCSWITATLIWYIGSYMLLPIDFNGKLEIFLKHFKKKNFFFGLHVWVIGLWLFFRYSLLSLKSCQLCFFF